MSNEKSLIKQLTTRINGLSLVSKSANFSTKLMIANGIFNSKLCNLIQLWGGTEDYLLKSLQVTQNKVMRVVTGMCWFTPSGVLWLSVKQLVAYHTLMTVQKTVLSASPIYLSEKLCQSNHDHYTWQIVKFDDKFEGKTERSKKSFCYRGAIQYNMLPIEIRSSMSLQSYKRKIKWWIMRNVTVD